MAIRTFTFNQAQAMLPVLEGLMRNALRSKQRIEKINKQFEELGHKILLSGGMLVDIGRFGKLRREREFLLQKVKDTLAEINAAGVQVKDIETGLLDFPCYVDGDVILLCWKLGEKKISHWHRRREGFASRKLINDRIINAKPRGKGRVS